MTPPASIVVDLRQEVDERRHPLDPRWFSEAERGLVIELLTDAHAPAVGLSRIQDQRIERQIRGADEKQVVAHALHRIGHVPRSPGRKRILDHRHRKHADT